MDEARLAACGRDVELIAAQALDGACRDEASLGSLVSAVEARIAVELESDPGRIESPPACGPGCCACCTVNVATLAVEGIAIAAFLRQRLPPSEVPARAAALLTFHERVRWCEDDERIRVGLTCPFLDRRGACTVHPVRPLACRAVSSLDAGECRRALAERDDEDDAAGAVRMNLLQKALYDEARRDVASVLAARGLDARARDVSGMAGVFLADAGLAGAYVAGSRIPLE